MAKVSLSIPEELWWEFRRRCFEHKVSASARITTLVANQVLQWNTSDKDSRSSDAFKKWLWSDKGLDAWYVPAKVFPDSPPPQPERV